MVGHRNMIGFLKRHIEDDNVSDVIIFHGNPGIGKSSIAKLLAIEVVTRYAKEELREKYKKSIIDDNASTDSIKLFNMSAIQEKEEEIQKVISELSTTFSSTGRKVLILDEAHNMSQKAQDAILTVLESLPSGVYVFICTTEIGCLRSALLSRAKATFRLNDLTDVEAKQVLKREIAARHLSFEVSSDMAVALIATWADNQPRKMLNLLENFKDNTTISTRDLEVFINTTSASSVIELLRYLYGSMVLGIAYLDSVKFEESFPTMLIEVCKVAMGGQSSSLSRDDAMYIANFISGKDVNNIIQFTAEVAGLPSLRKRNVISAFMRSHKSFRRVEAESINESHANDIKELRENIELPLDVFAQGEIPAAPTLSEYFAKGESF